MAEQAEAGDVGQGMHAGQFRQLHAGYIQLRGAFKHGAIAGITQQAFLERRGKYAHAERLAENQYIAGARAAVAFYFFGVDHSGNGESVNRLHRINTMAAGDRNAGLLTYRLAAAQDLADRRVWQGVDWHADDRQRHQRAPAHRIDIRERVGGGNAAEIERIIDDRISSCRSSMILSTSAALP